MKNLDARLKRLEEREGGQLTVIVAERGESHEQALARYLVANPGRSGSGVVSVYTGVARALTNAGGVMPRLAESGSAGLI